MSSVHTTLTAEHDHESSSDSEDETVLVVKEIRPKRFAFNGRSWRVLFVMSACVVTVVGVCILIAFLAHSSQADGGQEQDQDDAFIVMQDLMESDDLNSKQNDSFVIAFNTFDTDSDGALDETEFCSYFQRELNFSHFFDKVDGDGDRVISYPEAVVYMKITNNIPQVRENTLEMVGVVEEWYGFAYDAADPSSYDEYLEYVAIMEYFEPFDLDHNGYIHQDEFLDVSSKNEFMVYDVDADGKITFNEFYNLLYGHDKNSWKGQMSQEFGDDYETVMGKIVAASVTPESARALDVNVNVIQVLRQEDGPSRRRLGWCWYVYICYSNGCGYYYKCG